MKGNQDNLRERVIRYQEQEGVKSKYICIKLYFDEAYFCRWRKAQKDLNEECYLKLQQFLESKGY